MSESPKIFKMRYVLVSDASDLHLEQTLVFLRKSHSFLNIALLCGITHTVLKEFKDRDYAVTPAIEKVQNRIVFENERYLSSSGLYVWLKAFRFSCPKFFNALDSLIKHIWAFVENHSCPN
jgi:hypothetical protein